ncbi:hypothetical protein J6590_065423 [Homalodisca vitripennis]|nr:hypothetical protein J6590_065423 [Homalodisca vitripennis]
MEGLSQTGILGYFAVVRLYRELRFILKLPFPVGRFVCSRHLQKCHSFFICPGSNLPSPFQHLCTQLSNSNISHASQNVTTHTNRWHVVKSSTATEEPYSPAG